MTLPPHLRTYIEQIFSAKFHSLDQPYQYDERQDIVEILKRMGCSEKAEELEKDRVAVDEPKFELQNNF